MNSDGRLTFILDKPVNDKNEAFRFAALLPTADLRNEARNAASARDWAKVNKLLTDYKVIRIDI